MPHKGGVRFDVDSPEYRVSPSGSPPARRPPQADDPRLERLEILPGATRAASRARRSS